MRGNSLGLRTESSLPLPNPSLSARPHPVPPDTVCSFHACVLSTSASLVLASSVALVVHATTTRWYMSHMGATSSLCFVSVLPPLFLLHDAYTKKRHHLLRGCVIFATLQLVLPSYRMHEVKAYWSWTPAQRLDYNQGAGQIITWVDTAHMLFVVVACSGLALERSLLQKGVPHASAFALGMVGASCATLQAVLYPIDGSSPASYSVNTTLVVGILLTILFSIHYAWWSPHSMISYAGVFAVVTCFLAASTMYVVLYSADVWTTSPRPADVWSNAFHFFTALVIALHIYMIDTPCIRGWKTVAALLVGILAIHMSVFLHVPEPYTRTFFVVFDLALLFASSALVRVSWRHLYS